MSTVKTSSLAMPSHRGNAGAVGPRRRRSPSADHPARMPPRLLPRRRRPIGTEHAGADRVHASADDLLMPELAPSNHGVLSVEFYKLAIVVIIPPVRPVLPKKITIAQDQFIY